MSDVPLRPTENRKFFQSNHQNPESLDLLDFALARFSQTGRPEDKGTMHFSLAFTHNIIKDSMYSIKSLQGGLNLNEIYTTKESFFKAAITRFDYENSKDPTNDADDDGRIQPRELLYAQRLYKEVLSLCNNDGSEHLLLAARSQHILRWKIPRDSFPKNKQGYLEWRSKLKEFHAATSTRILLEVGYDKETIEKVRNLVLKKSFPQDPESRVLEDALCLVFLKYQLTDFANKTKDEEKIINALKKSLAKMTDEGKNQAMKITFDVPVISLVERALSSK